MRFIRHCACAVTLVVTVCGLLVYLVINAVLILVRDSCWFLLVDGPLALAGAFLGAELTEYRNRLRAKRNERV